jgi:glucokinase
MDKYVVAIDIGGTNTELAIVDELGNVIEHNSFMTKTKDSFDGYVHAISEEILSLIERNNLTGKVNKIGVGAPNANFFSGCVEHAPNLIWKGILPIKELLSNYTHIPVVLTNDANAAAIGEHVFGNAHNYNDFVLVTLGTGLGSGFFVNGDLMYGSDGFAGELGHVVVDRHSDRLCGCGRKGCLETYASSTGIVNTAIEKLKNSDVPSVLRNMPLENITSLDIANAANEGDALALEIFDFTADVLAAALANMVAITSPKAIILSGGLAKSGDLLLKPLRIYFENYLLPLFKNKVEILPSALIDKNTGLLGAAALAFNNN